MFCVATVDDSSSPEECEECEPVASILDVFSSSQVVCTEQETQGPESVIVVAVANADTHRLPRAQSCNIISVSISLFYITLMFS